MDVLLIFATHGGAVWVGNRARYSCVQYTALAADVWGGIRSP